MLEVQGFDEKAPSFSFFERNGRDGKYNHIIVCSDNGWQMPLISKFIYFGTKNTIDCY